MSKKGRRLLLAGVLTTIVVASLAIFVTGVPSVTARKPELKTPWGEPDLQGIWTREVDIPLERPAKYANQEFFSDSERRELDQQISDIIKRTARKSAAREGPSATSTVSSPRNRSRSICPSADAPHSSWTRRRENSPVLHRRLRRAGCVSTVPARVPSTHGGLQGEPSRLRWRKVRPGLTQTK
jgi:hypothetical protein